MSRPVTILALIAFAVATAAAAPAGAVPETPAPAAGTLPPARDGNIWDNYDHQLDRAQARATQRRSGVYPSSRRRARQIATERELNQQLLGAASRPPSGASPH